MASSLRPFRLFQIGKEATKGTRVAATVKVVGDGYLKEIQKRYYSGYPRGVRATVGGDGVTVMKGSEFTLESEATFEDLLWPCFTGILGNVTPANASNEYTYNFTPGLTAHPTLNSATIEFVQADGSTNHIVSESGYAMTRSFKIGFSSPEDVVRLSWSGFARARQSDTPTGSLNPYTGREEIKAGLFTGYIDDVYANIGNTALAGIVRSVDWECMTGLEPDHTAEGRADLDFAQHKVNSIGAKLNVVLELDAVAATQFANWRAGTRLYIRLKWTGTTIVSNPKKLQIDGSYRIIDTPAFSEDGDTVLCSFACEAVYDTTGSKIFTVQVVNALANI